MTTSRAIHNSEAEGGFETFFGDVLNVDGDVEDILLRCGICLSARVMTYVESL